MANKSKDWRATNYSQDGTPHSWLLKLADGCTLALHDIHGVQEQRSILKLQLKGINYEKLFTRRMPDEPDPEGSLAWAEECAWHHLLDLKCLTGEAQDALLR